LETSIRLQPHCLEAVLAALHDRGVARVLDLGCGDGTLVRMLLHDQRFSDIVGMDVSRRRLDRAASRLHLEDRPPPQHQRLTLVHGSLLYRDPRLVGYEAAVLIEVIEHLEPTRLGMFAQVLFGYTRPGLVILTIPNREYNSMWPRLRAGGFRHRDHRFEWTRAKFEQWATPVAEQYGYAVDVSAVGADDPHVGSPTQMGIFTRCR
jgi:3' terminal RNA ribose 2'-O-methyltransferase Hen1